MKTTYRISIKNSFVLLLFAWSLFMVQFFFRNCLVTLYKAFPHCFFPFNLRAEVKIKLLLEKTTELHYYIIINIFNDFHTVVLYTP